MTGAACQFFNAVHYVLWLYLLAMLVYAVTSWVPDLRGNWVRYLAAVIEPVLTPVRRIVPPAAGIDWSFMIVWLIIIVIDRIAIAQATSACFPI
ncbi:MAG TPA: YggT family protein [Candidatus Baltobacteraceae bacterium]